jgi:surface polysaccharide O-acyltransferase-like enzyme
MGYFFFVSGYLFFRKFDMSQLLRKWKTRVRSLLVPFLIWNVIAFAVLWHFKVPEGLKLWQLFLDVNNLADGPLWYVLCIMEYIVLTPVIYYLLKNKWTFWVTWGILVVGNIMFNLNQDNAFFYSLPFFVMGAGLALHYHERLEAFTDAPDRSRGWGRAILMFVLVTGVLLLFFYDVDAGYHKYSHFLNRIVAPLVVFGCFRNCRITKEHPIWKSSFFIYCGHELLIKECMTHYVVNAFLFSIDYPWITLSVVGIGCFATGVAGSLIILYLVLHRFCPKLCGILSGGR